VTTVDLVELVAAARAGDRAAFEQLVRATSADMYTLAYRLTGNEEEQQRKSKTSRHEAVSSGSVCALPPMR